MTSNELSDTDLLVLSRTRPEMLGVVYERHAPAVYRYLGCRVGVGAAEDLLGEVFVAAVAARLRVRPHDSGSALPWLYGIAGNVAARPLLCRWWGCRRTQVAVRASLMGTNFASDSASSQSGSEPATMPQPANSRI